MLKERIEVRFHRGTLADSLATMETIENNKESIRKFIQEKTMLPLGDLTSSYYTFDSRIDKHIWLIKDQYGIILFTHDEPNLG